MSLILVIDKQLQKRYKLTTGAIITRVKIEYVTINNPPKKRRIIMELREYADAVAMYVGNGAQVKEVTKANGIVKTGIVVNQGNICPTVYIEQMYEEGYSVQQAAAMVMDIAEKNKITGSFDPKVFLDYEGFIKPNLRARLYNKATPAEVKRSAAPKGFKGLIIVPYVELHDLINGTKGSIKVTKEHVENWGVTEKEVIDTALENSARDVVVTDLFERFSSMTGMGFEEMADSGLLPPGPRQLIVSNKSTVCGAIAILSKIKEFKDKFSDGFYVLPSSIHEVIVCPATGDDNEQQLFDKMVSEVNATTVLPEERLADTAFFFA